MTETEKRFGWSVQVGRVLGVPIRVHLTTLILVVWFGISRSQGGHDPLLATSLLVAIFGCVLLHELGHAGMALVFGVSTREIVLYPIGGVARLERIPGGIAELLIALAGPAVNLILVLGLSVMIIVVFPTSMRVGELLETWPDLLPSLLLANMMLFLFNLVPAFPMDGGRMLRAALSLALPAEKATAIAAAVGQGIALLFAAGGIVTGNLLLVVIAIFVYLGASQEAAYFRHLAMIRGRTAREAMITGFETLAPQDSLAHASRLLVEGPQQEFPVIDAWNRLVGVLPRFLLLESLSGLGGSSAVLQVMDRDPTVVRPDASLEEVWRLLRARPRFPVFVLDNERLIGMINWQKLRDCVELSSLNARTDDGAPRERLTPSSPPDRRSDPPGDEA